MGGSLQRHGVPSPVSYVHRPAHTGPGATNQSTLMCKEKSGVFGTTYGGTHLREKTSTYQLTSS